MLGIAIASDTPSAQWYYPSDPPSVTSKVYAWLTQATPVFVRMPWTQAALHAYLGPAQLAFADGRSSHVMVHPAFYLALLHPSRDQGLVVVRYPYPGVVAYREGTHTGFLRAPALFAWLRRDAFRPRFLPEEYTPAQKAAIEAVLTSSWRGLFAGLFPSFPSPTACAIPRGGPSPSSTMAGTCAKYVRTAGRTTQITLTETWRNGARQHTWSFEVGPYGRILRSTESGDVAPQYWR